MIYTRVSSKDQVEEGNSLTTQERRCREYAEKQALRIVRVFSDQGESAKTTDRPQLQEMLAFCSDRKNAVAAVIVYKVDRLSRNTDDHSMLRIAFKSRRVDLLSATEQFDNSSVGRFMENMLANVAQFDNDVRTERSVGGMREAVREGRYVWSAPFGYQNRVRDAHGKATIAPDPLEAPIVRQAFELVASGMYAVEDVRRALHSAGLKKKDGGLFSSSHFYRLLRNPVYAGWIHKFGERRRATFEPLVSQELFDRAQRAMDRRKKVHGVQERDHPDFPLRRFVSFSWEKPPLTGSWSRGKTGKRYPYYRFPDPGISFRRDGLHQVFAAFMDCWGLKQPLLAQLKRFARHKHQRSTADTRQEAAHIGSRLAELDELELLLIEKNGKGIVTDEVLQRQLAKIEDERGTLREIQSVISEEVEDAEDLIARVEDYLLSPGRVWLGSKPFAQRCLQEFQFPSRVTFDGKSFGTPEVAHVFALKSSFGDDFSLEVDHLDQIWNSLLRDCKRLAAILQEEHRGSGTVRPAP